MLKRAADVQYPEDKKRGDREMVSIAQKTPGQKLEHDKSRSRMTKKLAITRSGVIGLYGQ